MASSSMRRSSGLWRDEMRDSMNWSIGKRRFWLNSRIVSFWLARSILRTSGDAEVGDGFQGGVQEKVKWGLFRSVKDYSIRNIV